MKTYVLAASKPWYGGMAERLAACLGCRFYTVSQPEELTVEWLKEIKPRYIFFPHWSWLIPEEIWEEYESIIFHMTDVPYGRGGSPLQNLIVRGIEETVLTALRCGKGLDAGPVYFKRPLSLHGTAEEVFLRAVPVIEEMITEIVKDEPQAVPQRGQVTPFRRRTRAEGDIGNLDSLRSVYDFIRMLDAEGYPPAFLEHGVLRFEFDRASLKYGRVEANVRITLREKG